MTARRPNTCGRRDAFTLVELLVVIGIIGILIAILMPVLNKINQQARAARCAANLADMGRAWRMYADANQGVCVPGRLPRIEATRSYGMGPFNAYRPRWYELLGAQVKKLANPRPTTDQDDTWLVNDPWFLCPAVPEYRNSRNYPYGYNHQFLGNARPRADGKMTNFPVKAAGIRGDTVMALDSLGTAAGKPKKDRTGYLIDGSKDEAAVLNKGYLVDPPRLTDSSDYADVKNRRPIHRSGPDARHMGMVNVVFCDGHVERRTIQSLGYLVRLDGSIAVEGPGVHNKLFSGDGTDRDPPPVR